MKQCCDACSKSKFALGGKTKEKFGNICGLVCECHISPQHNQQLQEKWEEGLNRRLKKTIFWALIVIFGEVIIEIIIKTIIYLWTKN